MLLRSKDDNKEEQNGGNLGIYKQAALKGI